MIGIVDYGVGNLFSLRSSFSVIGIDTQVSGDPETIRSWDKIILPGVGAFGDAAAKLQALGLTELLKEQAANGTPILGICLGMQLLFEKSFEYGKHQGLGLINGSVEPIAPLLPAGYKVPHIGWNALRFPSGKPVSPLFRHIHEGDYVYFVHSYSGRHCESSLIADTEYGAWLTAAVARDNVFGCQFHPEKSGEVGLNILKAFAEL